MTNDFDVAAEFYDTTFTYSNIGKMQRAVVHNYLTKNILHKKRLNILEINCGTGEDAKWLAKQDHYITATDISKKMVEKAKLKSQNKPNLKFKVLDVNHLDTFNTDEKYDLIFSNFGGLNCINQKQFELFFLNTTKILSENGKLVLVIMPKNCIWEQFYFLLRGKTKEAYRRNTNNSIVANVDGESVNTWYHNPKEITNISNTHFKNIEYKPVGFFIPPSYLERFFKKMTPILKTLNVFESLIHNFRFLSKYSDHYLISLTLK